MVYDRYIYQVYTTYWARARTSVAPTEYRPEVDVSVAFIGLFPCLNSNGTFTFVSSPLVHHGYTTLYLASLQIVAGL